MGGSRRPRAGATCRSASASAEARLPAGMSGLERQTTIYRGGVSGQRPKVPTDAGKLEARARRKMGREAFAYVAAGAGSGDSVTGNRRALDRWRIVPRMLRDVSERDTSVELFGRRHSVPFLLAPIGVLQ